LTEAIRNLLGPHVILIPMAFDILRLRLGMRSRFPCQAQDQERQ
jgi:hypothetical protein